MKLFYLVPLLATFVLAAHELAGKGREGSGVAAEQAEERLRLAFSPNSMAWNCSKDRQCSVVPQISRRPASTAAQSPLLTPRAQNEPFPSRVTHSRRVDLSKDSAIMRAEQ
jgi:hypothetical protein